MLRFSFQEFALRIEYIKENANVRTDNRETLYRAIYQQIRDYKNLNTLKLEDGTFAEGEAAQVHQFFVIADSEAGIQVPVRKKGRQASDPVSNSLDRLKNIASGKAGWKSTIAIYYWFHRDDARAAFAKKIDDAVFGEPFHEKFNLTRDEYTPFVRDERDFAIGPLLFSCDDHAIDLPLPTEPRGSILDDGHPSPAKALSWRYGLTDFVGRDEQLQALQEWVEASPGELSIRLLSGVGGSGKTRFAAKLASELKAKGQRWNAGFFGKGSDKTTPLFTPMNGVLIIIDYPEEQMEFVVALIDGFRDRSEAHVSVRVLLLSRLDQGHWDYAARALGQRFSIQSTDATGALDIGNALAVSTQAHDGLASIAKTQRQMPEGAQDWLKADALHCLPLFAAAAGVHAFLAPEDAFGLNGAAVVEALAAIEIDRVRAYSKSVGLGDYGLERLLALATFSDTGLTQSKIEALREEGLPLELKGQALIDALAKTPWWTAQPGYEDGVLQKLSPDRIAVAFMALNLLNTKMSRLPTWLVFVMSPYGADVGSVFGRMMFDLSIHDARYRQVLEGLMLGMFDDQPRAIETFRDAAFREHSVYSAPFAIKLISLLLDKADGPNERATLLHNLATNLQILKRYDDAIDAYERCIALQKKAARWPWSGQKAKHALAVSLGNFANCLSSAGQTERAGKKSRQALKLRQSVTQASPKKNRRGLAVSLMNTADHRIAEGAIGDAVQLASEAASICEEIYESGGADINPDWARALHNLAKAQALSGEAESALSNIQRAVAIRRELHAQRPHEYSNDFGSVLISLSKLARGCKDYELAETAAQEALPIFEALGRSQPNIYGPSLGEAYLSLGAVSLQTKNLKEAYEHGCAAVRHYQSSDWKTVPYITAGLVESWLLVSECLAELGNAEQALDKALNALMVLEEVDEHPDLKAPYATTLKTLAVSFMELERSEKAVECSSGAVQLLRTLTIVQSLGAGELLRAALKTHAEMLRTVGRVDDAELIDAEIELVSIIASEK